MALFRCSAHGVFASTAVWSLRIHFTSGSSVTAVETDWKTAMTAAWSTVGNPINAVLPTTTVLNEFKTEALTVVTVSGSPPVNKLRAVAQSIDTVSIAGTSSNPALPDQNAILVTLRGPLPGKENNGRIHLPAPDQTLVTAGAISSTVAGHMSTAINGALSSMASAGHSSCVATYVLSKTLRAVGTTSAVNAALTDEVIRTVRARAKSRKAVYV